MLIGIKVETRLAYGWRSGSHGARRSIAGRSIADRSAATMFATEHSTSGHNHFPASRRKVEEVIGKVMLVEAGK